MQDLESRFSEVEKRMRALIADNARLKTRISELEQELSDVRREALEFQNLQGKSIHIREKIERVLHSLETIGDKTP